MPDVDAEVDDPPHAQGVGAGRQPVLAVDLPAADDVGDGTGDDVARHEVDPRVGIQRHEWQHVAQQGAAEAVQALEGG